MESKIVPEAMSKRSMKKDERDGMNLCSELQVRRDGHASGMNMWICLHYTPHRRQCVQM